MWKRGDDGERMDPDRTRLEPRCVGRGALRDREGHRRSGNRGRLPAAVSVQGSTGIGWLE